MQLIKPSFEILEQGPGLQGIYKQIELAGRTCYKSLDKITEDSAEGFVNRMIASQHYAMLEHGTVYLLFSENAYSNMDRKFVEKYEHNPYSKVKYIGCDDDLVEVGSEGKHIYTGDILKVGVYGNYIHAITTNLRVLVENGWLDDLKYLCEPTESHEKRVTVKFTTDRGVSHEFVRHRVFSFAQESTRYCNYSKDKFGNEITFIMPSWIDKYSRDKLDESGHREDGTSDMFIADELEAEFRSVEARYFAMLIAGCTPQEARQVLPNALKTELVMTGFVSDWQHFFRLRTSIIAETGKPHPDASALADPLYKEFLSRGYMESLV